MDVIRAVLGEQKINYLGYSYGTYLGAVYGSLFPKQLTNGSVPLTRERPEDWPFYWPKEFDRTVLDRFLATGAQPRSIWDVVAEVVGEVRQAAATNTALSHDASTAVGMLYQQGIAKVDSGVYDTVTCEADWPTETVTPPES
jgi:pimeloyl-ACP methyl ester carboxylesterase